MTYAKTMNLPRALLFGSILPLLFTSAASAQAFTPDDPFFSSSWYATKLNLPEAWSYSLGSPSVVVAVLDTGVIANEPDLGGRVLPSPPGTPPPTSNHHGTWVAGTVAMGINNGIGGVGVGNFSILPITVTDDNGFNSSDDVAAAIRLAADSGAKVINISLKTLRYGELNDAAAYALSKGALTFVAAGNDDARIDLSGVDHPGSANPGADNLIFVSGTNRNDQRWHETEPDGTVVGSSWGPYVDLSAPADDIIVPEDTLPAGYGHIDGTSFAAPLAAGEAALVWSINPKLTPDQVRNILYSTAVDLGDPGYDEVFGHGRIDIGAAAAAAEASLPEPGVGMLSAFIILAKLSRRRR